MLLTGDVWIFWSEIINLEIPVRLLKLEIIFGIVNA